MGKTNFRKGLERLLVSGIITVGSLIGNTEASWMEVKINSNLNNPSVNLIHYSQASEGFDDGLDSPNIQPPNGIDIYSKTSFSYPNDKLDQEARGSDSMTPFYNEIVGVNLNASPVAANLEVTINSLEGENNMLNKKVIGKFYDAKGTSDTSDDDLLGVYDCWNMTESRQTVPLIVKEGLSHRWVVEFYNTNIDASVKSGFG